MQLVLHNLDLSTYRRTHLFFYFILIIILHSPLKTPGPIWYQIGPEV